MQTVASVESNWRNLPGAQLGSAHAVETACKGRTARLLADQYMTRVPADWDGRDFSYLADGGTATAGTEVTVQSVSNHGFNGLQVLVRTADGWTAQVEPRLLRLV